MGSTEQAQHSVRGWAQLYLTSSWGFNSLLLHPPRIVLCFSLFPPAPPWSIFYQPQVLTIPFQYCFLPFSSIHLPLSDLYVFSCNGWLSHLRLCHLRIPLSYFGCSVYNFQERFQGLVVTPPSWSSPQWLFELPYFSDWSVKWNTVWQFIKN